MSKVTAVMMDVVTEKSNHAFPPLGVSVCLTPAAPAPLPIPYPVFGQSNEGLEDTPLRTKVNGVNFLTVGAIAKKCHGNEPGTLKEIVSLNTTGPIFPILGAPTVIAELGMIAITLSPGFENRAMSPGMNGSASAASGTGNAGSGTTQDGSKDGEDKKTDENQNNASGTGDETSTGATETPPEPKEDKYCPHEHPGKATPPFTKSEAEEAHLKEKEKKNIDRQDLRNVDINDIINMKDPIARRELRKARYGKPGGATKDKKQAFWSGDMEVPRKEGATIQEDNQGAALLGKSWDEQKNKEWNTESVGDTNIKDENVLVTRRKLWTTISRRSAENAKGSVDAYVIGSAKPDNIFASVELPTLLHNENLNEIQFKNPSNPKAKPIIWTKGPDGCWTGPPVPATDNGKGELPGFRLHRDEGFTR